MNEAIDQPRCLRTVVNTYHPCTYLVGLLIHVSISVSSLFFDRHFVLEGHMSSTATSTTVKVTKQQLFSFLAVHARVPPNEPLLKKQQYSLFDDGVAFCRMFNAIFVQQTIAPIATSHQTSSASSRSTRNWKALHRAMTMLGIPTEVVPRELYRPNAVDSVGGYSGLVFFYFMHHLAKRRDFSAEFSSDVTGHLMSFLQSVDSIRALVLGGAIAISTLPQELHEYCSMPPPGAELLRNAAADAAEAQRGARPLGTGATSSGNISSVDHRDDGSEEYHPQPNPYNPRDPRVGDTPHPADAARALFYETAASTPYEGSSLQRTSKPTASPLTSSAYLFVSPGPPRPAEVHEERFFEGEQFIESAPAPHAASPKPGAAPQQFAARPNVPIPSHSSHHSSHHSSPPQEDTGVPTDEYDEASSTCDASDNIDVDVNVAAAQLQRLLLKRQFTAEGSEEAQALLWGILSTYHVTSMRLRRLEAGGDTSRTSPDRHEVQCAVLHEQLEESMRVNKSLRAQLETAHTALSQHEDEARALVSSHHSAVARLTEDIVRLRREHEASLSQQPLRHRCAKLTALCSTLRELDATSMDLITANVEETDEEVLFAIEELLEHRTELQKRAAQMVQDLKTFDDGSDTHIGNAESTTAMISEALEERVRSVTASRDQLLEELQQLSQDASCWCDEATSLRRQHRNGEALERQVGELEAEILRRNVVIDELRAKLGAAIGELDNLRRSSVQRQREHSAVWSVSRPLNHPDGSFDAASPAARTPQTVGDITKSSNAPVTGEPSVPRFTLSSPGALSTPSPRAPTEARVVDGPYNVTLEPHPAVEADELKYAAPKRPQPSIRSHHITLRDLDTLDDPIAA